MPAFAMRCGNKLVTEGDYSVEVIHKCGDPDYVSEWIEYHYEASHFNYHTLGEGRRVPVLIEEWTYNFGPRRLMRRLRFKKGKLQTIHTMHYGFRKDSRK